MHKRIKDYFEGAIAQAIEAVRREVFNVGMDATHYEFSLSKSGRFIRVQAECDPRKRTSVSVDLEAFDAALEIETALADRCIHGRVMRWAERPLDELERGNGQRYVSASMRQKVIQRDGYICGICGGEVAPEDIHIDHVEPVIKGGDSHFLNLRVTHSRCNLRKGAKREQPLPMWAKVNGFEPAPMREKKH